MPPDDKRRGRPTRAGERATERTEIRFTLREIRELRELAAHNGTDVCGVIRQGIDEVRRQSEEGELPATIDGARLLSGIAGASPSRRKAP